MSREFGELAYLSRPYKAEDGQPRSFTEKEQMDMYALELWRDRAKKKDQVDTTSWFGGVVDPNDDPWKW
ncbi:MAG: hypothetical protein L0226_16365 [Acidobacteria bacterium]|nr:hypothetical protein [Acidobacteriota bacterium]